MRDITGEGLEYAAEVNSKGRLVTVHYSVDEVGGKVRELSLTKETDAADKQVIEDILPKITN